MSLVYIITRDPKPSSSCEWLWRGLCSLPPFRCHVLHAMRYQESPGRAAVMSRRRTARPCCVRLSPCKVTTITASESAVSMERCCCSCGRSMWAELRFRARYARRHNDVGATTTAVDNDGYAGRRRPSSTSETRIVYVGACSA